jgi:hypothetical protein
LATLVNTFLGLATPYASPPSCPSIFFQLFFFWSTTLLNGMTGISLLMQWPLTSQLHGSVSQREQLFFFTDQTPRMLVDTWKWFILVVTC